MQHDMMIEPPKSFRLDIEREARGKGRPKTRVIAGSYAQIYTDKETTLFELMIACYAAQHIVPEGNILRRTIIGYRKIEQVREAMKPHILFPTGSLHFTYEHQVVIPKSYSKKDRQLALDGGMDRVGRFDVDNVGKGLLDGMNGVVFKDDSQVTSVLWRQRYTDSTQPLIRLRIEPVKLAESLWLSAFEK